MTLTGIWNTLRLQGHKTDKGDVHSYIEVYENLLEPYRHTARNILEIGLFNGASMRMWEKYFTGKVYGIDCDEQPHGGMADLRPMIKEGTHNIFIMDATDAVSIEKNFSGIKFDVIIEDAGHMITQQLQLYNLWKQYLNPGGIYIIEDIQDIYSNRIILENIDSDKQVEIIDLREIKKRYDDVMVTIR